MHVLIIGAGGFVGRHLAGRLHAAGVRITAAARSVFRTERLLPNMRVIRCDLAQDTEADWLPRLAGIDAVVNCAGLIRDVGGRYDAVHDEGARALFAACRTAGVARVIQVSALGAAPDGATRYHRTKAAADTYLASLDPSGQDMDWAVVRPSLIVGRGGQSTSLFVAVAALPFPLRLGAGDWLLQPIHVDDLVAGIARLLDREDPIAATIDFVGPEPMTTDALTAALRQWLGLALAPMLPVPGALIGLAARLGQTIGLGAVTPESLTMLKTGNTAPVDGFIAACGFRPATIADALARTPATAADIREARMASLAPVLRILLALVWLAGGLIPLLLTPWQQSMALLAQVGIVGAMASPVLIAASLIDIAIGAALLLRLRIRDAAAAGIAVMAAYSAILAIAFPHLWADPFGPLVKNLAVLGLALVVRAQEVDHG